ncbi:MAG: methylenetetrahydrofolate--tRNA-(uracil(54)-C(5))-methyltransferase (FADH(2)-oxidizing) TrmFO [Oscillospiraceae bacterium]|nr:methylenetetrahydrofolate--tRNA-(uracil(54)-C(5))-methyltransferase (FADH(2)-oxidizing) TrmFO [Oscillospiraceae bacterium]
MNKITVIGAGLAGCEAAHKLSSLGFSVRLCEMKPEKRTPAQKSDGFAELVCSNSLKAMRLESAAGLLKEEMRCLGSVTMEAAEKTSVAAGGALAVDRELFSEYITEKIKSDPNIEVVTGEVTELPSDGIVIVATGPLTSDALAESLRQKFGGTLSFFDAVAPIVTTDSIDMNRVFMGARYDRGEADYINCPMERDEYDAFYDALVSAERAPLHDFDVADPKVYEGCMPIEVMAGRGRDTLRYGPLRPVGLIDPHTGRRPWANIQLRKENAAGTMYNIVGFQTNLKFGEQKRVFSMIPGLEHAEFVRYGVMHRDTFMDSPRLLSKSLSLKSEPRLFFAGQFTGVEGYTESAATGILAGINAARFASGEEPLVLPPETMLGALVNYITDESVDNFQPMGANMGILPPLEKKIRHKDERYAALAERAIAGLEAVL